MAQNTSPNATNRVASVSSSEKIELENAISAVDTLNDFVVSLSKTPVGESEKAKIRRLKTKEKCNQLTGVARKKHEGFILVAHAKFKEDLTVDRCIVLGFHENNFFSARSRHLHKMGHGTFGKLRGNKLNSFTEIKKYLDSLQADSESEDLLNNATIVNRAIASIIQIGKEAKATLEILVKKPHTWSIFLNPNEIEEQDNVVPKLKSRAFH